MLRDVRRLELGVRPAPRVLGVDDWALSPGPRFLEGPGLAPEEAARASLRHVSELVGVPPDTIRGWVDRARVDAKEKPGVTTAEREEIKALRKEVAELRRANEILKTASAFFAAAE